MILEVSKLLRMCQHQENNIKCSNLAFRCLNTLVGDYVQIRFICKEHTPTNYHSSVLINTKWHGAYGLGYDINGNLTNF